jgi:hypothetical protein
LMPSRSAWPRSSCAWRAVALTDFPPESFPAFPSRRQRQWPRQYFLLGQFTLGRPRAQVAICPALETAAIY